MFDVVVVGAGPAGLSAAAFSAIRGAKVLLVDDNPRPGGQIWRHAHRDRPPNDHIRLLTDMLATHNAEVRQSCTVVDAPEPGRLLAVDDDGPAYIHYRKLILATGARELFLPFPGWTLPSVLGVGGLQALLKSGVDLTGKRVVVAGSGPLLLAVGAALVHGRAEVVGVFEQAPWGQVVRFGAEAMFRYGKAFEAAKYRLALRFAPYEMGAWVVEASGDGKLKSVKLTDGRRTWIEECDYLGCSYGLVPNIELAELLGCEIENGKVVVDDDLQTSVPNVYAIGELLGVGGLDLGTAEGHFAGGSLEGHTRSRRTAHRLAPFREALARGFALRPEVLNLAKPDTIVCRCEDVRMHDLSPQMDRREAKLCTRLGMGPCQGRVCGAATQTMFGWERDRVRPPLYPAEVRSLATHKGDTD